MPYPASWVNRFSQHLDRKPLPAWGYYLVGALALTTIFIGVQYWQGAYRQAGFYGWHIFVALQPLIPVAAIHYMDRVADSSLARFRHTFKGSEQDFRLARYRLTTAPAQGSLMRGLAGFVSSIVLFVLLQDLGASYNLTRVSASAPSQIVFLAYILIAWFGFGTWVFHTVHQLLVINKLYTENARVDPSYPDPLYSLSAITSRTAIFILANTYGWFGLNTVSYRSAVVELPALIITNLFFVGLGLLIFIWPLWGAHRLLDEVKSMALAKNSQHHKRAVKELHHRVEARNVAGIDGWEKALSALHIERLQLERLPIWPWAPGSLRNFLLALVVPVLVWFVQFGLQRLLE